MIWYMFLNISVNIYTKVETGQIRRKKKKQRRKVRKCEDHPPTITVNVELKMHQKEERNEDKKKERKKKGTFNDQH